MLRSGEAATRCRRPGAEAMALPFTCPLDYVLPPGRLDDDPARFGPALDAREWSFLEHPRAAWLRRVRPVASPAWLGCEAGRQGHSLLRLLRCPRILDHTSVSISSKSEA